MNRTPTEYAFVGWTLFIIFVLVSIDMSKQIITKKDRKQAVKDSIEVTKPKAQHE